MARLKTSNSLLASDDLTLVVGDVHIAPNQNLRRAAWLGAAIENIQPDRVVFIGDFLTFDCLSAWDVNKRKKMEGRRYHKDIDSGKKFIDNMNQEIKKADPEFIFIEGNHEDRLWRYLDGDPTFAGHVDYRKDLGIDHWQHVPYKEYYIHKGVHFTHIPFNEARPIGGKYAAFKALDNHQYSTVFGHTHKLSTAGQHRTGAKHLSQALNVGCFFEHVDDYAVGTVTSYWRGIVLIDHYKNGRFGWNPISMGKLRKFYDGQRV